MIGTNLRKWLFLATALSKVVTTRPVESGRWLANATSTWGWEAGG